MYATCIKDTCYCEKCISYKENKIKKQAEDLKEKYPEFDLNYACKSYIFLNLISSGVSLNLIYPQLKDEIEEDIKRIYQGKLETLKLALKELEEET